jgi:probable HAF family extracellular repeat protein
MFRAEVEPHEHEEAVMRAKRFLLAAMLVAPTLTARARDQPLWIELEQRSEALPGGVSAAGAVVVGGLLSGGGFYWMPTTGAISIGGAFASKVSRDGHTIVGRAADSRGIMNAAIWLRAAEWKLLGSFGANATPCDASLSTATDTSSNGGVVVGLAWNGCNLSHAFRWEESTGMVDLGSSVAGRASLATGVSGDGKVVVGHQEQAGGFTQGARWVDGRQELFPGPDGFVGTANAANSDGSIVVGRICSPAASRPTDQNFQSAWVWTMRDGTRCLRAPSLRVSPGPLIIVEANATSDDGRVIGGGQNVGGSPDSDAVIWIDGTASYLKDYLRANGVPDAFERWINTGAITGISPDGRVLVGSGAALGGFRGYIVILGELP